MTGFVTLQRKATEHHLFAGDSAKLGAWFWLVAKACWKPTKFNVNGKTITIERGQFCCSIRDLAEAWGWSKSSVDRFLTRLKIETMIGTDVGTGRLVITICNYEKYQDLGSKAGTATGTPTGTAAGQQRDTKEPLNQETIVLEEPNGPSKTARGAFPRPDWADAQVWSDFLRNRKTKRLSNTATAHKQFITDITALADVDWPPGRLLEQIVARGWGAAFDPRPKDQTNANRNHQNNGFAPAGNRGPVDRRDGFLRSLDASIAGAGPGDPAAPAGRPDARPVAGSDDLPLAGARALR